MRPLVQRKGLKDTWRSMKKDQPSPQNAESQLDSGTSEAIHVKKAALARRQQSQPLAAAQSHSAVFTAQL